MPLPTAPFTLGGQNGWEHDEARPSGYFHTYDALAVGPAGFQPRKVHVYLPREYASSEARYPVVYMNDGHTTFWPGGPGNITWDVDARLDELYATNAIPHVIVVAIHPIEREREYSHVDMGDGKPCCDLPKYTDYVADDVKGFIDTYYRTQKEPANTAIIGSSRGGLASFYMANKRPEKFGKAACMSPSFWAGLDPVFGGNFPGGPLSGSVLVSTLQGTLSTPNTRPKLWIDWGLVRTGRVPERYHRGRGHRTRKRKWWGCSRGRMAMSKAKRSSGRKIPTAGTTRYSWGKRFPNVMKALFGH